MSAVTVNRVSVDYDGSPALRDLSLTVASGRWMGLIGPNGAGKTTLLRALAGLAPAAGDIALGDAPLRSLSRREVARRIAYVPQRPELPASMTVADYVLMGRTPHLGYLGVEGATDLTVVGDVLEVLHLLPLGGRALGTLSGGEAQRAVLGRALAQEAAVLLLDEPTASLDIGHGQQVLELVDRLRLERGLTIVSAMHDLTLAGQFAEDLVLLSGGRLVAAGPARAVLTEATLRRHYGASIRVLETPESEVVVVAGRNRGTGSAGPQRSGGTGSAGPQRSGGTGSAGPGDAADTGDAARNS